MFNIFSLGPFSFHTYGFLVGVSVAVGFFIFFRCLAWYKNKGFFNGVSYAEPLLFVSLLGGVAGARLLFVLYHLEFFLRSPGEIIAVWNGGWVWHGALFGALAAGWLFCKIKKISFLPFADAVAPSLAFGQALGRWGNFVNQEAYGAPTNVSWGIYIDGAHRVAGYEAFTTFHPTFLYESVFDFFLFFLLLFLMRQRGKREGHPVWGVLFALYLLLYSLARFFIEFLRIDVVPVVVYVRLPQWISLFLIGYAIWFLISCKKERA